jgi:pimeloyl-ACP methyl ester carboxylesterase
MGKEFVFVHGMSHGAWCWELVQARLEKAGHRTLAVDLPGHGRRAHEWRRASVGAYARAVADAMIQAGFHRAVVVGHSMGGVVIPKVAELVPARVAHLVFLAAVVLPHGASLLETQVPLPGRGLLRGLAASGRGAVQYPAVIEHARWMNDLPPGDPRVVAALVRLTPQPFQPWVDRVDMRRFYAMAVPRTYVRCLRDAAIPPARAAEYAARLGVTPIDLDTAHGPMLSAPAALATILEKV